MPIHATTQPLLLEPPRQKPGNIISKRREKRLKLALGHLKRALHDAPFLRKQIRLAMRNCILVAERTAAKDEAEILQVLKEGWQSTKAIAALTPSKVSEEQVNKILHELAGLDEPVVRKGRERDPNFEVGRGGNRYVVVWSLLIDEGDTA